MDTMPGMLWTKDRVEKWLREHGATGDTGLAVVLASDIVYDYEAALANQYERIDGFVALVDQLERQLAERDASFDLRWNANMQAIQRWQEATGEELKWPNHVDLCMWLMQQLAAKDARIAQLEAQEVTP